MAEQLGHFWSLNLVRVMVRLSPALTDRAGGVELEYQKYRHQGTPFQKNKQGGLLTAQLFLGITVLLT